MTYHEIRVRPVVRYVVTEYRQYEGTRGSSVSLGEYDNVDLANHIGKLVADSRLGAKVVFEPARSLRIEWIREPGAPQETIRWALHETGDEKLVGDRYSEKDLAELFESAATE